MGAMGLTLPTPGGSTGVWDTELNTALTSIEEHTHTSGDGNQIPAAGINIDANLSFGGNSLTNMGFVGFAGITDAAAASGSIYRNSVDDEFYWKTAGGVAVQLTNGAGINTSLVGGITGDYSTTDADVEYVDADKTYEFKQDEPPDHWANLKTGNITIFEPASGIVNGIRQLSPVALAAAYDVTWLTALPATAGLVQMDSSGQLSVDATETLHVPINLPEGAGGGTGTVQCQNAGPGTGDTWWAPTGTAAEFSVRLPVKEGMRIREVHAYVVDNHASNRIDFDVESQAMTPGVAPGTPAAIGSTDSTTVQSANVVKLSVTGQTEVVAADTIYQARVTMISTHKIYHITVVVDYGA